MTELKANRHYKDHATSAMLHNLSTLGISLRSMTDLLEQKPSL